MIDSKLEAVESLRVMRAEGNLTIARTGSDEVKISCDRGPEVRRSNSQAEILLRGNAILGVPNSVALEILETTGNLLVEGFRGNLALGRIGGNLRLAGVGSAAIRGEIGGNLEVESATNVDGENVRGNLTLSQLKSARFITVGGNAEAMEVSEKLAIDQIGGRFRLEACPATATIGKVGDKLEIDDSGPVSAETVGGKVRAEDVGGELKIGSVGGKIFVEQARGSVRVAMVGGHAALRAIEGDVDLPSVGGAVSLRGHYRPGTQWTIRSGGRIIAELPPDASVDIDATSRFGRVRVQGIQGALQWLGRERLSGKLGDGQCRVKLETTGGDVILESPTEFSREEGWGFARRRFGAPFEAWADDLRTEIPGLVNEIVDAAGKLASTTLSRGLVRDIAKSVTDGLREVERELKDLERAVPEKLGDQASKVSRRIRDLIAEIAEEGRAHHHSHRFRNREPWRRWREQWQRYESSRAAQDEARTSAEGAAGEAKQGTEAGAAPPSDDQVMKILQAVREGKIRPEEADELIRAWEEVNRPH